MSIRMETTAQAESVTARGWRGHLGEWRPEDPVFWRDCGARIARRNLAFSVFSEHIGFSLWSLWSVLVLFLGPAYHIDAAGKFLLTAVPTLVGSVLRLPYTAAVGRFGGRNWTVLNAALLLAPTLLAAWALRPGVSFSTLLVVAAVAGVGGGNFASSMTNINAFYPARLKGWALGINAGGGNLGVAAIQLVGLIVLAAAGAGHPRILLAVYAPLIVIAAVCAALFMDNLAPARTGRRALRAACRERDTWLISVLYIGTFGSFIGFSFAFGQVLQVQFPGDFATPVRAAYLTFLGPLVGSLARPVGGWLADRRGGALISCGTFVAMAAGAIVVLVASHEKSLPLYLVGFILLFILSGIGNGSTYKMIPAIFRDRPDAARISGSVIGIAGAAGAFGGVLVNLAFRQSFLATGSANAAYIGFIAFYVLCVAVTTACYLRRGI